MKRERVEGGPQARGSARQPIHVAYVLRRFPQASETFVANEIVQLERSGARVSVFSCRRPLAPVPHACVRRIQGPIRYLHDPLTRDVPALLREIGAVFRHAPGRFGRSLGWTVLQALRSRSLDPLKRFVQAVSLSHHLIESDVDQLHAHFAHAATLVAMLASMLCGIGFSFTAHAYEIFTEGADFRLLREQVARAVFAVTVSRYNHSFLVQKLGAEAGSRIHTLYNGVDLKAFHPDGPEEEPDLIVAVGRLVEKKGLSHLIEAVGILVEQGCAVRCEIVGEGALHERLAGEIEARALQGRVRLVGLRAQEELPDLYRRAAAVVLPAVLGSDGNRDALPTVLLEALACGTAVVASRLAGIPEIVTDGETGLLVEPGDATALAGAIGGLLADPDRRARLGRAGRRVAEEKFDLAKNAGALRERIERERLAKETVR